LKKSYALAALNLFLSLLEDDFLKNDCEAEGDEDLIGVRPVVEMLDQATFHDEAEQQHDGNGKQDGNRY